MDATVDAMTTTATTWIDICDRVPWAIILIAYVVIFIDLFYGLIISAICRETKSHKMLKGLQSKMFVLSIPIIGVVIKAFFICCSLPLTWSGTENINQLLGIDTLSNFPICFLLCGFVILMEIYSMLESSAKIDVRAKHILAKFNKEAKKELESGEIAKKIMKG